MDQLEEYRRSQEERYRQSSQAKATPPPPIQPPQQARPNPPQIRPPIPPPIPQQPPQRPPAYQEDQRRAAPPMQHSAESDEEYARRLQAQFYAEEQEQVRPPINVQRQERLVEPHYAYPQAARQPLLHQTPPPPISQPTSFWPEVDDKCCGFSSQRLVLGTAAGMVVAIIVVLIVLSV